MTDCVLLILYSNTKKNHTYTKIFIIIIIIVEIYKSLNVVKKNRYSILCPHLVKDPIKIEKAAAIIMDQVGLPDEQYRLGKTKVYILSHREK